jgi:penicillin amidase
MKPWLKIVVGVITVLSVFIVIGGAIVYQLLAKSIPDYSGEYDCSVLKYRVEIYFDEYAIPHIYSNTEEDAAFTLGFLHARERLFQMDIIRRAAEGRLSEIFGDATVPFDKMFLTIGIKRIAYSNLKMVHSQTRKMLSAYAKGVNFYIEKNKGNLPPEFDVLNYKPYNWKPEHSLMIIRMMAWDLNLSWWTDFAFTKLVQSIDEEKAKTILPDYPENAPYVIPPGLQKKPMLDLSFMETDILFRKFIGFNGTHIGSNNWVINSSLSSSGKPIIANDPHLGLQAPGKWYAAVIRAGSLNAEGVTMPGVPGIVIGKNKNISWVLTNVMADDADFYFEKIDSTGKKYFFNNQWKDLQIIYDTIRVKNETEIINRTVQTHRGPIVSGIHPYKKFYPITYDKNLNVSMCWNGNFFSDEYFSFYSINVARNWNEFKSAVEYFATPGQNFVYADKTGNIGYICGARLPLRNSNAPSFIFDGTNDLNDWKGFVQYEKMPLLLNPPQNYIASANNKTVKEFPYHISNLWEPSSRIERITELLNAKTKHSVLDFQNYQTDIVSPYAKEIVNFIVMAFKDKKIKDKNLKETLIQLEKWDGKMDAFYITPTIYAVFLEKFMKNVLVDDLGDELYNELCFVPNVFYRTIQKICRENNSSLFDDRTTSRIETRDEMIRKSLGDALTELEKTLEPKIVNWQWGKLHTLTFRHMFSGRSSILDKIVDIGEYGIGGDGTTLFNTEYSFARYKSKIKTVEGRPYENYLGPSMRFIYNFADTTKFYMILTTGQSGHPLSEHYKDMTEYWLRGKYIEVSIEDVIKKLSVKKIILKP